MRTCLVSLLTLAPLLGLAGAAHAHIGDQIYPSSSYSMRIWTGST